MNKLVKSFLVGLAAFFVVYLLGSFVAVSFDISQWDESARTFVALGGAIASLLFASASHDLWD